MAAANNTAQASRRSFDTLAPQFRVRINGVDLPVAAAADLIAASVLEDVDATSMFTFTLLAWDGVKMQVKWIDDKLFKEGNSVEIEMGYRDKMKTLVKGEITGLEPEFPNGLPPTLLVRGYDRRHRLMGKTKTQTFVKMKDSDIANKIAVDWGLKPDIQDTEVKLDYVLQHNQTDFNFLRERAQRIGYEMVVADQTLRFKRRQNQGSATVTLSRQVELLEFSLRLSTIGQVEELSVQGWDVKKKDSVIARSKTGDERQMGGSSSGSAMVRQVFKGTGTIGVTTPVLSQAEAEQLATARFCELALAYVEGNGLCIGQPELRAGSLVKLEGLGERFSGSYYVTSAEHRYRPSAGYRTAFTARRNAT